MSNHNEIGSISDNADSSISIDCMTTGFVPNCSMNEMSHAPKNSDLPEDPVSDVTRDYFELIFMVILNCVVSLFGTGANIINIVVFARMGVKKDVVNISLLALSVSDLISVFLVVWCSICYILYMLDPPNLQFDPLAFYYVTAGWPHFIFSRVTCYITAVISIERCLCVVAPFKVKEIVTPKKVKILMMIIFIIFPCSYIPVLKVHRLGWGFDSRHNETRIMADFTEDRDRVQALSYYINDLFFPTLSLITTVICAVLTIISLRKGVRWKREKGIVANDTRESFSTKTTTKELRVVKMLVVICAMFLVCYSPSIILLYIRIFYPELSMYRHYHNLFVCIYCLVFLLEISNSSFNIIVYLTMSSKFKETFKSMLHPGNDITEESMSTQKSAIKG